MSDHANNADTRNYRAISVGLEAARGVPELPADCRCHFCDEVLTANALFGDVSCPGETYPSGLAVCILRDRMGP